MPDLVLGSPPRGTDFFGGEKFIASLRRRLGNDNVLLVAPRKFGKTGTLLRLLDEPDIPFRPVYLDVTNVATAGDFMVELIAALLGSHWFAPVVRQLWKDLELPADTAELKIALREKTDTAKEWEDTGDELMDLLSQEAPPLLLLIDEFGNMIHSMVRRRRDDEIKDLLDWFQNARVTHHTYVRFVLGSSLDLLATLEVMSLFDSVNDLWIANVEPFTPEKARNFMTEIFAGRGLTLPSELADEILELVGVPIPHLLAVTLKAILDRQRLEDKAPDREMVHAAFRDLLEGPQGSAFNHYPTRLADGYSQAEARISKALLSALSRNEEPVTRRVLFREFLKAGKVEDEENFKKSPKVFAYLMSRLENDFYISGHDKQYLFFSRLLRLWWKTRFAYQHV